MKIDVPVSPSKIVCVGLNYTDHAKELEMEIPEEPIIFYKTINSSDWTFDTIIYPRMFYTS